jgi:hypothetical protein
MAEELVELADLRRRAEAVGARLTTVVRRTVGTLRLFKLSMIVVGGGIATATQFVPDTETWRTPVGVVAALSALIGGVLVAFTERDAAADLERAHRALDLAQLYLSQRDQLATSVGELFASANKQRNLHEAGRVMRETIEQAIMQGRSDEFALLSSLLTLPERLLRGAMDFDADERWIVSIFKHMDKDGEPRLVKLVEHRADRSEESDVEGAVRSWAPGEGFVGAAFNQRGEVVLPDLNDPEVTRLIYVSKANREKHDDDTERYRSCAAVSVLVGPIDKKGEQVPWGVVTAASNKIGRFHYELDEPGFQHAEAVRLVAEMVALGIGALHMMGRTEPQPTGGPPKGGDGDAGEQPEPQPKGMVKPLETRE